MSADLSSCLEPGTNDGIVPVFSQIWGRFGGAVVGDHLDVVGQFEHISQGQVYTGWLVSGSEFDEQRFRKLWSEIAAVIASNE